MQNLQQVIDQAFERRAEFTPANAPQELKQAVEEVLNGLDACSLRVA